jgi:hypothetical protein
MLGREGSGRLRVVASQQKMKLNAKAMKKWAPCCRLGWPAAGRLVPCRA